jgi:Ni/Fe-hydrogenase 1 B-type cytochrome subunit
MMGSYVWEFPVRLTHWVNATAVVILCFTGYYIGHPYINTVNPLFYGVNLKDQWVMGWMRLIHITVAYCFTMSVILRIYWAFAGNSHSNWRTFLPLTRKNRQDLWRYIQFYLFIRREPPHTVGHSPLAGLAYFVLFMGFFAVIVSGFALYSQGHTGFFWKLMGGWLLPYIHPQYMRLIHHTLMWFLIVFPIAHKYIAWISDLSREGCVMSSMFSGYKVCDEEDPGCRDR